uniref:Phycocyanin PC645 alpha-1 subunit n=2 Tax=unclassified Chroomonas TaxID=2636995 RepID=PHEA1_CHRS2|nr:RecName: Full=Phycocyanin PC645 alpha-1 subunit; Short=PC645A1 [Chroomonas sp. CCMP270]AGY96990.1 phycocyanin645 alpha subunit [Chroomonas sp. CCMP270]
MIAKTVAVLALAGSAAAYAPTMSLSANRRELVQGAAAAAVVAPLLRPTGASARDAQLRAPIVEIFDARGCDAKNAQYTGPKSNDMNDDQCVKVSMQKITVSEATAAKKLQEFIGGKATAINVPIISSMTKKY